MTTTNTIIYSSKKILKRAKKKMDVKAGGIRIVDWRQTSEGFPFDVLIEFAGGAKEMHAAIALVRSEIDTAASIDKSGNKVGATSL